VSRPERLEEARSLAGQALDITVPAAERVFDFAISAATPVALNLIGHVRDGGRVASIVPVPEGANINNRLTIYELYHQTDAATLDAVLAAASQGHLIIPISQVFPLAQIGAAHDAMAAGASGKIVLKH